MPPAAISPLRGSNLMGSGAGSTYSSCTSASSGSRPIHSPREHKAPCCGSCLIIAPMVLISVWQATVVKKYSAVWPNAIWNGETVDMSDACKKLFLVIHWTLGLNLIITTLEAGALAVAVVPQLQAFFWACVYVSSAMECCAGLVRCALAMWGMLVVVGTNSKNCNKCMDLYDCAWWCFIGIFGLSLLVGSCLYCLASSFAKSDTGSRRANAVGRSM